MQIRPLEGVVVVSLENAAAAPLCSRNLADLGARVIKVERPGGEHARHVDRVIGHWSSADLWVNPSKESLSLDFKDARSVEILFRLAERADIMIENLRPGMAREMGLHFEALRQRNARLVFCHISGYGQDGPFRDRKVFDFITQGEIGLIDLTGTPEAPARIGGGIVDSMSAQHATIAVLSALLKARETGIGEEVDVSMLESSMWFLSQIPFRYWYCGDRPKRMGLRHPFHSLYGAYQAADGPLIIAVITQTMWQSCCAMIGRPELVDDPRFGSNEDRNQHKSEIDGIVEPIFRQRTRVEWQQACDQAGIPCGALNTLGEALDHPQLKHRGFITELDSEHGPIKLFNFPAKFSGQYCSPRSLPHGAGADSERVLAECGYSEREIGLLRQDGVI